MLTNRGYYCCQCGVAAQTFCLASVSYWNQLTPSVYLKLSKPTSFECPTTQPICLADELVSRFASWPCSPFGFPVSVYSLPVPVVCFQPTVHSPFLPVVLQDSDSSSDLVPASGCLPGNDPCSLPSLDPHSFPYSYSLSFFWGLLLTSALSCQTMSSSTGLTPKMLCSLSSIHFSSQSLWGLFHFSVIP